MWKGGWTRELEFVSPGWNSRRQDIFAALVCGRFVQTRVLVAHLPRCRSAGSTRGAPVGAGAPLVVLSAA
jgi:hypothetical protein